MYSLFDQPPEEEGDAADAAEAPTDEPADSSADAPEDEPETAEQKAERLRAALLGRLRSGRPLTNIQARVAGLLSQFPETRNSDVTLQLQYWRVYERHLLQGDMPSPELYYKATRLTSIARARQVIQHELNLFLPTDARVLEERQRQSDRFRIDYAPADASVPSVFVYADESGKNETHLVVGSVWVLAPAELVAFEAEVKEWRETNNVPYELHAAKLGDRQLGAFRSFIERFVVGWGILGFKAVAVPRAGIADQAAAFNDLFFYLLKRGVEHEHHSGRAPLPRQLSFLKDPEEQGRDEMLRAALNTRMAAESRTAFDGQLYFEAQEAPASKYETLLQIADLFTWCVNRTLNHPTPPGAQPNWKQQFVDWFLAAVSFELEEVGAISDRAVRLSLSSPSLVTASTRTFTTPEEVLAGHGSKDGVSDSSIEVDGAIAEREIADVGEEGALELGDHDGALPETDPAENDNAAPGTTRGG